MSHLWLSLRAEDIETELLQCEQEGRDLTRVAGDVEFLRSAKPEDPRTKAAMDRVRTAPMRGDLEFQEPEELSEIRSVRPSERATKKRVSAEDLEDRIEGGWYGRCAGCLLGKPVEGWPRAKIEGYLRETGRHPLSYFFSCEAPDAVREKYGIDRRGAFIENIEFMPEDDDLNYTVAALAIMERYGERFTSKNVADFWLEHIPVLRTCTAERIAYKNLVNNIVPPESALEGNPYREWIGAQIRADLWGFVNPGDPETAAEFAWRDGRVSHIKNGVFGEMWVAAMIASAFTEASVIGVIEAGLGEIPANCRLARAIRMQIENGANLSSAEDAIADIHSRWDESREHDWCHVISNAEVVTMALLWGDKDFERSICLAVEAGFDTDCNAATVGSIIGVMQGRFFLPERWIKPLNDTLQTGVLGFQRVSIEKLAARTVRVASKIARV